MSMTPTYRKFFQRAIGERHVFLQGGRRSGKTFATFQWLSVLGGLQGNTTIIVLTYQLPQLQATMADFTLVTGVEPIQSVRDGYKAETKGVKWRFVHCDEKGKAQGTQADYLFVNEAVNFPQQKGIIETYAMGIREQIYYNFNPTKSWGYMQTRANANNVLCTTWRDNADNLTKDQLQEFEDIRLRAMRPNATIFDKFNYEVYYRGNFATMVGAVFTNLQTCTDAEYSDIPATEYFGMDFGFATSGDPTTLMGCKIHNNKVYFKQYIYERGLTSDEELGHRLISLGLNYATMIFADYGGMGRGRMDTLITANNGKWGTAECPNTEDLAKGFCVCNAPKGEILQGIASIIAFDNVVLTESSTEARAEFENYELTDQQKPQGDDHCIDAGRYAFLYAKQVA